MSDQVARISELAEQVRGVSYGKEEASRTPKPGYLPVLRAGNITDDGLVFDDLVYVPAARISPKQMIRQHDVVIAASSGSLDVVGKAARALADFEGGFGAFCKVLRPRPGVDPAYFAHFFKTHDYRRRVSALAAGININNLRNEHLDDMMIPYPALPEQRRIAEVLDRTEALRAKRRAALVQLDALTQSVFLDMFGDPARNPKGWPVVRFGDLLANIDSGWSPPCLDRPAMDHEWGVLKLGAVTWCEYDPTENKALPPEVEPDVDIEVKAGDLLFSRKNTYDLVAACALVHDTPPRLMMSDLIFRLRLRADAAMDPCFLHQLLMYPTKRKGIQRLAGGSAGSMPNISKARLASARIEVPPLPLQRAFAKHVTAIQSLKRSYGASLIELGGLAASLQYRAFRGEL